MGNWTCPDFRKIAIANLFGGERGMPRFQNKRISKIIWLKMGHAAFQEK